VWPSPLALGSKILALARYAFLQHQHRQLLKSFVHNLR
jgi:hypothetical protein